ncbi:hypothetical protein ACFL1X_00055 [Candidatus Hydrogenedentota bacterium]
METIVYSSRVDDVVRRLEQMLAAVCVATQTIVRSVQGDAESLRRVLRDAKHADIVGIVLVVRDMDEMKDIVSIESTLTSFRSILVIPESNNEILTLGQELRPRLYVDIDDDFSQIASVIDNISRKRRTASHDSSAKEW